MFLNGMIKEVAKIESEKQNKTLANDRLNPIGYNEILNLIKTFDDKQTDYHKQRQFNLCFIDFVTKTRKYSKQQVKYFRTKLNQIDKSWIDTDTHPLHTMTNFKEFITKSSELSPRIENLERFKNDKKFRAKLYEDIVIDFNRY